MDDDDSAVNKLCRELGIPEPKPSTRCREWMRRVAADLVQQHIDEDPPMPRFRL